MASKMFSKLSDEGSSVLCSVWNFISNWKEHKILMVTIVVVSAAKLHFIVLNNRKRAAARQEWDSAGQDVVVLHGFPRAKVLPTISPFVLKLETYLRIAGIKYKYDPDHAIGPKRKSPWITLNGEDHSDSQLIIELLDKKFKKNLNLRLSQEQKAIARAMIVMSDEHLFWGLEWWRFVKDESNEVATLMDFSNMGPFFLRFLRHLMRKALWAQGLSRHSHNEVQEIIRKDLQALSTYLGSKSYLMRETPTEVDCAIFGMIAQFVWAAPRSPFYKMIQSDFKNLQRYCERVRDSFWSDWEELLQK